MCQPSEQIGRVSAKKQVVVKPIKKRGQTWSLLNTYKENFSSETKLRSLHAEELQSMQAGDVCDALLHKNAPFSWLPLWYLYQKTYVLIEASVFVLDRHVYFLGWTPLRDHPAPNPPSSAPTQTTRVPI
jgi:hypothetical protein